MPISFSIAGIRAVDKPRLQPHSGNNHNNENQKPREINATISSDNGEAANASEATTTSKSKQSSLSNLSEDSIHKCPGSGKLTITKKKGKTGYTETIVYRFPFHTEDYDSSDDEGDSGNQDIYVPPRLLLQTDEAILMDRLDAEITRQEEKELFDRWNYEILAQEQAELMERLLINIEHAEYLEKCAAKPSVVTFVEDPNEPEKAPPLLSIQVPKNNSPSKLVFQPAIGESPSIANGVEITDKIDFCKVRIMLPRYLDQEHKILAFTRGEFYTCVIQPFEKEMLGETGKSFYGWGVSLSVSSEDPFSYVLEARGIRPVVDELKTQVEFWIQDRICMINSNLLLQDGASVVIRSGIKPRLDFEEIKSNYNEMVVSRTEKSFGWIDKGTSEKPTSLEHWKVQVKSKEDQKICVILARGTTEVLRKLEEFTRHWVETESLNAHPLEIYPLQSNSKGPHIRKLQMTFPLARYVPLGIFNRKPKPSKTLLPPHYSKCGVWLSGIKDGTRLAFMMGGPAVFEKGCSLLAIDDRECNTTEDVKHIYSGARDNDSNVVTMTICLSRYTDFQAIPHFENLNPTRLDGERFDLKDYEKPDLIVARTIDKQQHQKHQQPADEERGVPVELPGDVEQQPDDGIEPPDFATADKDFQQQEEPCVPERASMEEIGKSHADCIRRLLGNEMSIEIDIMFSSDESLGVSCSQATVQGGGVLLLKPKKNSQFLRVLGDASKFNIVLWKINEVIVDHFAQLQSLLARAKQNGKFLRCLLVMHEGTDLTQVDQSKLIPGGGPNPRRRNGDTLSLIKQLPPPKRSTAKVSSDSEEEWDFSAEWADCVDSSDSDNITSVDKKKPANASTKKSSASKTSSTKTTKPNTTTISRKAKVSYSSNVDLFNDSDCDESTLADEIKIKHIPRKKDSAFKTTATILAGRPSKRVAESVVASKPRIPKKARPILGTMNISDRSVSSSLASSANRSQAVSSREIRPTNRLAKANAETTTSISRVASSRESSVANSSVRPPLRGTASDPLAELHRFSSKSPTKQKRILVTQPTEEPPGKKRKGSSIGGNRNTGRTTTPIPRRKSNEPIGSGLEKEYEVAFPYNEPIGAFFRTEGSKCKVFSVFKKGNAMKDKNIVPGTLAVAISISGVRHGISNHDELREQYFRARERQSKIHIFFVNSEVMSHTMDFHSRLDWTETGVWTGRYEGGWAGGAKTKNGGNDSILKANKTSRSDLTSPRLGVREHHKVSFSDFNSVREFIKGSWQWHDPISDEIEIEPQPLSPVDILKDAVVNHSFTKLIEVLQTGMTSDLDIIGRALPKHYDYVKSAAINEIERGRRNDMQNKKNIIGIYDRVCKCVEEAMELSHTRGFEFSVKSVELKKKPESGNSGRTELLSGRVSIKRGKIVEELGSLHKKKTKAFVSYDESERRVFLASCNSRLTIAPPELTIVFREGILEDPTPSAKIGSTTIPVGEIDRNCPRGEPLLIREDLKPGSILSEGSVAIEFNRLDNERDYAEKRRIELTESLKLEISYIKRFNEEECGGRMRLTANIQSIGNATPLHAAINLKSDELVKQLLEVGADPHAKSTLYGDPILQAMKFKDRTLERLQNLINNGYPMSQTEPIQKVYDTYCRILQLLKPKQAAPGGADEILDESDEDEDYYSGDVSGVPEDDQKKRQFEVMQDIFNRAQNQTKVGGLDYGAEANKSFVMGMLRLDYSKDCPNVVKVKEFVADAIRRKVLVSISPTKFRLGAAVGSQDQDNAMKKKEAPLPEIQLSWLYLGKRACPHYPAGRCKRDHRCHFAHIHQVPSDGNSRLVLQSKELLRMKKDRFVLDNENLKTLHLDGWFTAGYYNPKISNSMYFYAEGGKGQVSRFGVNWYRTLPEAKEALQRVLTLRKVGSRRWREILNQERSATRGDSFSQLSSRNQHLPVLEDTDWMDKSVEFPRCPNGTDLKNIENRDFWTIEARFGDKIGHQLKIFLNPEDVYTLERNGFYTSAFADRQYNKIIYVEGGNAKINDQGVHWYGSESEARNALEPVVSASRKRSVAR